MNPHRSHLSHYNHVQQSYAQANYAQESETDFYYKLMNEISTGSSMGTFTPTLDLPNCQQQLLTPLYPILPDTYTPLDEHHSSPASPWHGMSQLDLSSNEHTHQNTHQGMDYSLPNAWSNNHQVLPTPQGMDLSLPDAWSNNHQFSPRPPYPNSPPAHAAPDIHRTSPATPWSNIRQDSATLTQQPSNDHLSAPTNPWPEMRDENATPTQHLPFAQPPRPNIRQENAISVQQQPAAQPQHHNMRDDNATPTQQHPFAQPPHPSHPTANITPNQYHISPTPTYPSDQQSMALIPYPSLPHRPAPSDTPQHPAPSSDPSYNNAMALIPHQSLPIANPPHNPLNYPPMTNLPTTALHRSHPSWMSQLPAKGDKRRQARLHAFVMVSKYGYPSLGLLASFGVGRPRWPWSAENGPHPPRQAETKLELDAWREYLQVVVRMREGLEGKEKSNVGKRRLNRGERSKKSGRGVIGGKKGGGGGSGGRAFKGQFFL